MTIHPLNWDEAAQAACEAVLLKAPCVPRPLIRQTSVRAKTKSFKTPFKIT